MRLLICAGGTGGGVYPALVVLQAVRKLSLSGDKMTAVRWIGGEGGLEEKLLAREQVDFVTIPAAGVHGVSLRKLPGNLIQLWKGLLRARKIIRDFDPDVMFFTGGYLAVPVALAGLSIPSLVYVPDIKPGLALKTIARLTDWIAVTVEESREFFGKNKKVLVSGYPVRESLLNWDDPQAYQQLDLNPEKTTVLVFGGSKGARSINKALRSSLKSLLSELQIIHISGELDWKMMKTFRETLPGDLRQNYRLYPYLHQEMGAAFRCADLVVSRAGASILGEYPEFGLPAILVPYPYAWDYQIRNARYLEERGAAEILYDQDLEEELETRLLELVKDSDRLQVMAQAMKSLQASRPAEEIALRLLEIGSRKQEKRSR